jgi:hypothetical protein
LNTFYLIFIHFIFKKIPFQLQQAMAQLQQIHKKHMEQQQRQNQQQQQHQHHLHSMNNIHNNNNNNSMNNSGGNSLKERNNTLSQLLEKNRGDRPQPTKAALTMPPSFQRGERPHSGLGGGSGGGSMHSHSPFGSLPSHMPHMQVTNNRRYVDFQLELNYFVT